MIQQYSHSGTLNIKENSVKDITDEVCKRIESTTDVTTIRKYLIEREQDFSSNYTSILKGMFENYFENTSIDSNTKALKLLEISEAIYRDSIVADKEINCFSCILKLNKCNG